MPRSPNDGYLKVAWIDYADKHFVSATVLNAATEIECELTKDGLSTGFTENTVDDGALCEAYDATLPGSYSTAVELTLKRRNTENGDTDLGWDLFNTRDEAGLLVVRRGILSDTAWTAAQPIETYPSTTGIRRPADVATNEQAKFMLTLFGSEAPDLDAVVVIS